MSYDIEVYGKESLPLREVPDFVSSGLVFHSSDGDDTSGSALLPDGEMCFTIEGPHDTREDNPRDARAAVDADLRFRYEIGVEGANAAQIERGLSFGALLAARIKGRVIDLQDPSVEIVDSAVDDEEELFLIAEWYRFHGDSSVDFMDHYIELATSLFPGALPHRFGNLGPARRSYAREGATGLAQMYREEGDRRTYLEGKGPLILGLFDGWKDELSSGQRYRSVFAATAVAEPHAAEAFEQFFLEMARRNDSYFAYASLSRSRFSSAIALSQYDEWPGLPRRMPWLSWFPTEYANLVRSHLPTGVMRETDQGLLFRSSKAVSTDRREGWVPEDFLPAVGKPDAPMASTASARVMPEFLRSRYPFIKVRTTDA